MLGGSQASPTLEHILHINIALDNPVSSCPRASLSFVPICHMDMAGRELWCCPEGGLHGADILFSGISGRRYSWTCRRYLLLEIYSTSHLSLLMGCSQHWAPGGSSSPLLALDID